MPKISFIITAFERPAALRTCLSSLIQQTEKEWEAVVVDNSPGTTYTELNEDVCKLDGRITYRNTSKFTKVEGQPHKHSLYQATDFGVLVMSSAPWLVFPNDDSYYCPWFAERMLRAAGEHNWDLVYCDLIAGGAGGHWYMRTEPKLCQIDKTSFLLARSRYIGFPAAATDYAKADGMMIEQLVRSGIRHGRVDQVLVTHN